MRISADPDPKPWGQPSITITVAFTKIGRDPRAQSEDLQGGPVLQVPARQQDDQREGGGHARPQGVWHHRGGLL